MIRIGIAGSDNRLITLVNQISDLEGVEVTGVLPENRLINEDIRLQNVVIYPTIEALLHYVDAVILNYDVASDVNLIDTCLKNFKHVFSVDTKDIPYSDISYLLKIAEESNVKFYPEFGEPVFTIPAEVYRKLSQHINYLDIHHMTQDESNFDSCLLQNLAFALNLINANVKRINANFWDGCGMNRQILNARLDFDNGSAANIILSNSNSSARFCAMAYGTSARTEINIGNGMEKFFIQSSDEDAELFSIDHEPGKTIISKISNFLSALNQESEGQKYMETQIRALRVNYLLHEKVKDYSSKNILYS